MKALFACEFSASGRDAFIRAGHEAVSCDVRPSESGLGEHWQKDITTINPREFEQFDLMVAHPPCTFLTNAGVHWLHTRPGRWDLLDMGAAFFRYLDSLPIERKAIENPIPHKYAIERIGRKYDQLIQPWQFGHGETKAICLWLTNLPKLKHTDVVSGRNPRVHQMPPGPDREKERSRFFSGISDAMADQWGSPSLDLLGDAA